MSQREADQGETMGLVFQVQCRQMKAAEAARRLAVSRKTYYQLEKRVLAGAVSGLAPKKAGRKGREKNPEAEALLQATATLQEQNLELRRRLRVREYLGEKSNGRKDAKKKAARREGPGDRTGP